jgi:hypothetical protein
MLFANDPDLVPAGEKACYIIGATALKLRYYNHKIA